MLRENGCWAIFRPTNLAVGRPCLLLDRDGVVVEETHYLHRREDVRMIPGVASMVRAAHELGWVCGLVTNQAGIGRGRYGWDDFHTVQEEITRRMAEDGAEFDFVVACPFHPDATVERYRAADHPWRKPAPGMITTALSAYAVPPSKSIMVGDCLTDMMAGAAAGVGHLVHVETGHGRRDRPHVLAWAEIRRPVHCLTDVVRLAPMLGEIKYAD